MAKPISSETSPAILAISSQVAYGAVGNSAAVPAMLALGLTVHAVPTIVLSYHPGLGTPSGLRIPARDLAALLEALEALGVLDGIAAVSTGYFAANDQIFAVQRIIARLKQRNPRLLYLCDPVIGDETSGLYVPEPVAEAIKQSLLPLADIITPNVFELAWLSGRPVRTIDDVRSARSRLAVPSLLATSLAAAPDRLLTVLTGSLDEATVESMRRSHVPHGTGDLLSGLLLGFLAKGEDGPAALSRSLAALEAVIDVSVGSPVLKLSALGGALHP
ncbi:MAG TPA: pyridoxal kinase [Aestuariivirgaceae bacterium]|nr:pyridoxal kinase [Aestuariivirgaceae bacterium]